MRARNDAWFAKVEQVYDKAQIAFGSDADFSDIQNIYERTTNAVGAAKEEKKKKNRENDRKENRAMALIWVIAIALWIGIFAIILLPRKIQEHKLETIVKEIEEDLVNNNFDGALIKANMLHMDKGSSQEKESWDQKREYLIKMIEEAKEANK